MNADEQQRSLKDPDYLIKKYFYKEKFCMSYDKSNCNKKIVGAHTISLQYLKNIAEADHVYTCNSSAHNMNNFYQFDRKGIKTVTRIKIFCEYHDTSLFESFEKNIFNPEYRQIYDCSFRALCREYALKQCLLKFKKGISDGGLEGIDITKYSKSPYFKEGLKHATNNVRNHKFLYEQLEKYKNTGLNYVVFLTSKLPISTTGVLFPIVDLNGNKIQNEDNKLHGFIYNVIPLENSSCIVISTVKSLHNVVHRKFLSSLCHFDSGKIINCLLTNFFLNNDNFALNPSWYDGLCDDFKQNLLKLMNAQVGFYDEPIMCKKIDFSDVIDFHVNKVIHCLK